MTQFSEWQEETRDEAFRILEDFENNPNGSVEGDGGESYFYERIIHVDEHRQLTLWVTFGGPNVFFKVMADEDWEVFKIEYNFHWGNTHIVSSVDLDSELGQAIEDITSPYRVKE